MKVTQLLYTHTHTHQIQVVGKLANLCRSACMCVCVCVKGRPCCGSQYNLNYSSGFLSRGHERTCPPSAKHKHTHTHIFVHQCVISVRPVRALAQRDSLKST